ncbi:porin family protein [Pseudolabrys taiwanensis]|uniref:Porin family protein n=1 Tax=Pseudolabrys taiwanensis TaxID=331696 RepID=A0A345ZT23_9HYPH|nr:outer membrane protein [Pseudolabrys taiwanensis]AXK80070.1 porin family protein [Pseudolabrys taiwanensis]
MKRGILSACAAAVLAAAAAVPSFAADIPRPVYKAPVYVAPVFTWTGFYLGINGGYAWGHSDWNNTPMGNVSLNAKGAMVGGTLGYNIQTGNFVFGLEGDIDATWISGSSQAGANGTVCTGPNNCESKNTWFGTARGRIGFAIDRFLPYITGGGAFGNIKATPNFGGSVNKTQFGWTAGAGVEWAFSGPWSAKLEYLYADLGKITCGADVCGVDTNVSYKTNLVRAGVNYRF